MIFLQLAALYSAGYTLLTDKTWSDKQLTRSELVFVQQMRSELNSYCAKDEDENCDTRREGLIMDAVNGRRINAEVMRHTSAADVVAGVCYSVDTVLEKLRCFSDLRSLNYDAAMERAGMRRFGVSKVAYRNLRVGMSMRDVEFLLGEGEEQAYAGGGGYSAAIYKWRRGSATIVLTFQDGLVSGRSQLGL